MRRNIHRRRSRLYLSAWLLTAMKFCRFQNSLWLIISQSTTKAGRYHVKIEPKAMDRLKISLFYQKHLCRLHKCFFVYFDGGGEISLFDNENLEKSARILKNSLTKFENSFFLAWNLTALWVNFNKKISQFGKKLPVQYAIILYLWILIRIYLWKLHKKLCRLLCTINKRRGGFARFVHKKFTI